MSTMELGLRRKTINVSSWIIEKISRNMILRGTNKKRMKNKKFKNVKIFLSYKYLKNIVKKKL